MKVTFTKGSGKFDQMLVERAGGASERVDCQKQRIIPHDMVHYAVESVLHKRGFLSRVATGEAASFTMQANEESDGVERLVEVFQGDAWSGGGTAASEMLDLYQVACGERTCAPLQVTVDDIEAIRTRLRELDAGWQALPVGGSMTLVLDATRN